jgi:hypothetical protein
MFRRRWDGYTLECPGCGERRTLKYFRLGTSGYHRCRFCEAAEQEQRRRKND